MSHRHLESTGGMKHQGELGHVAEIGLRSHLMLQLKVFN
jgi:hypothetical protein